MARIRRVLPRTGRSSASRGGVHPSVAIPQSLPLPGRGRLPAQPAARRDVAQPRLERADHRPGVDRSLGGRRRRRRADLPQPRLARLRRRPADGAAGGGARRHPPPLHRLEGAPARRVRARRQHGRRGVPAPDLGPPARRAGDHPRGNNTVTEALHFGVPMIVLPLFWDQHDNAQRMDETGSGIRLPTYGFEPRQMSEAIDGLIANDELGARLGAVAERLQASPGNERAAAMIARLAETGEPVAR
ncbi:MAG: glycosyltransferase [Solirubrobacterales bacterium]